MCLINILELLQITPHLLDVNIVTMLIGMYHYNLESVSLLTLLRLPSCMLSIPIFFSIQFSFINLL